MQPDSHLHLVCRHEVTFHNTLVSKEGKCWIVFLMGLSVAKRPTGDLIYRGGLDRMSLGGSCACVCMSAYCMGRLPQESASNSAFTGKVTIVLENYSNFSKNWLFWTLQWLHCSLEQWREIWGGWQLCEVRTGRVHEAEIKQGRTTLKGQRNFIT